MPDRNLPNSTKRILILMSVICGALFALSSFVIKPVYIVYSSDIIYMDSWFMYLLEALLTLCEVFAYSAIFAAVIYCTFSQRKLLGKLFIISGVIFLLRRLADVIMTLFCYGALALEDLYLVIFYILFEMLQVGLVYWIARMCSKKQSGDPFPVKKIFEKENPLQVSAILAGAVLSLIKVISRVIYDISYSLIYGLPQGIGEIMAMIAYYLSDIAIAFISYAFILVIIKLLLRKKESK